MYIMKKQKIKNSVKGEVDDVNLLLERKYIFFKTLIERTSTHVQKCKFLDILSIRDVHKCINSLKDISKILLELYENRDMYDSMHIVQTLQGINNEISSLLKTYGSENMDDLLIVCLGASSIIANNGNEKFDLIKKYFHPTGYNVVNIKNPEKGIMYENILCADSKFHMRVYGIKIIMYDSVNNKSLQITGVLDDILLDLYNNAYISRIKRSLITDAPTTEDFKSDAYKLFIESLMLKDYILHNGKELFSKFMGYMNEIKLINQKDMSTNVKKFIDEDTYSKRLMLIVLLVNSHIYEHQYMAYLLYDTLTTEVDNNIDTQEQTVIFDSMPWNIKEIFRNAMNITAEYTTQLSNFDINKVPLEQQICLMKVGDNVKEKAMTKLKEIKSKSEDNGGKPRQYLDGLLKIPFGIYRKETILKTMNEIKDDFMTIQGKEKDNKKYTSAEIMKCLTDYTNGLSSANKTRLIDIAKSINKFIKIKNIGNDKKIKYLVLQKEQLYDNIVSFMNENKGFYLPKYRTIHEKIDKIQDYMVEVKNTLDKSVYGHDKAKQQIFRIIGQWINGEQSGYCFGFEGPPGTGKTSLAKYGLSNCLKDDDGNARPFAMIQMGGDCQGSTLSGHNYTYVG